MRQRRRPRRTPGRPAQTPRRGLRRIPGRSARIPTNRLTSLPPQRPPRRGMRVGMGPAIPCDGCRACRDGYRNLCYNIVFSGHGETDGMMRELMPWPSHLLHPLPDSVSDAAGAMLEPLGVALWALDLG